MDGWKAHKMGGTGKGIQLPPEEQSSSSRVQPTRLEPLETSVSTTEDMNCKIIFIKGPIIPDTITHPLWLGTIT